MCLIGVRQNFTHRPHRTYFTQLSWLSHLRSLNNLNTWSHWLLAKFPASISSWGPFSFSFSASPRSWKSVANQHITNIWYWGKVHPLPPYRPRIIPLNNHPLRGMSWFHLVGACLRLDFWRLSWLLKEVKERELHDTSLKDLKFKLSCFSMLTLNISTLLSNTVLIAVPKLLI